MTVPERYRDLKTPCIVVDYHKTLENIKRVQQMADCNGVALRPHIKTHKMAEFARLQVEAGAKGVTCAKLTEAECMADGGIDDIFIAYPIVGAFRYEKALALYRKVKRLILAVDSQEGAQALNAFAAENQVTFEVRLEVDTGAKRTGVPRENALALAKEIVKLENLELTGIYTFKGLVLEGKPTTDRDAAGAEEGRLMHEVYEQLVQAGIPIREVSAGSTPTGESVAKTGLVTEVRPGTYIFGDYMVHKEGICTLEQISASFLATVVSVPCKDYAVIDGGSKTYSTDILLDQPPYYYEGYAQPVDGPDWKLSRLSEEHGILTSKSGNMTLKFGDKIRLFPVHVCPCINLQNTVYVDYGDRIEEKKVDARGGLW